MHTQQTEAMSDGIKLFPEFSLLCMPCLGVPSGGRFWYHSLWWLDALPTSAPAASSWHGHSICQGWAEGEDNLWNVIHINLTDTFYITPDRNLTPRLVPVFLTLPKPPRLMLVLLTLPTLPRLVPVHLTLASHPLDWRQSISTWHHTTRLVPVFLTLPKPPRLMLVLLTLPTTPWLVPVHLTLASHPLDWRQSISTRHHTTRLVPVLLTLTSHPLDWWKCILP